MTESDEQEIMRLQDLKGMNENVHEPPRIPNDHVWSGASTVYRSNIETDEERVGIAFSVYAVKTLMAFLQYSLCNDRMLPCRDSISLGL